MDTLPAIIPDETLTVGQTANRFANRTAHTRYRKTKARNTKRRQIADLQCFFTFLSMAHYEYDMTPFLLALKANDPLHDLWHLWEGITSGLVEAFILWQEEQGYAIGSIGVRLSTVKAYCNLAKRAEMITQSEFADIKIIESYSHKEGRNIDQERQNTRRGKKKTVPTTISAAHATLLKRQERPVDAVMMCLLLDIGLRCGELASLPVSAINLQSGTITFYREKVDKTQTHRLTPDCLRALQSYLPTVGGFYLFPGHIDKRNPQKSRDCHISTNGVNKRVGKLGEDIGIENLSPHDCRHHLLTEEASKGTDVKTLQYIGGWSSPIQAVKYINESKIANAGASFFRQSKDL